VALKPPVYHSPAPAMQRAPQSAGGIDRTASSRAAASSACSSHEVVSWDGLRPFPPGPSRAVEPLARELGVTKGSVYAPSRAATS
jgi:hypothetical protein